MNKTRRRRRNRIT